MFKRTAVKNQSGVFRPDTAFTAAVNEIKNKFFSEKLILVFLVKKLKNHFQG
ncbi:hypothetical protein Hanom_Chr14g01276141 [Helianthus anomalus]